MTAISATPNRAPLRGEPLSSGAKANPSRTIVEAALASLDDDKAVDPVLIDLAGKTTIADAMIIVSGTSNRHVAAMADHLIERLHKSGVRSVRVEGKATADWVLVDAGDVIVHLFRPEVRAFYDLERMWEAERPAPRLDEARAVVGTA